MASFEALHEEEKCPTEDTACETEVEASLGISHPFRNMGSDWQANEVGYSPGALDVAPSSGVLFDSQPFITVDLEGDLHASDKKAIHPDKHKVSMISLDGGQCQHGNACE